MTSDSTLVSTQPAAIVTGGSSGIGLACVEELLRCGFRVLFCGRSSAKLNEAVAYLQESGSDESSFSAIEADMGSPSGPELVIQQCVDLFGAVDALINNAGIYEACPLVEMTAEIWDKTLHCNLRGPALASAAAGRQMIAQGRGGRIVHIASLNAVSAEPGYAHYGSSKGGLMSLTKAMAVEFGPHGIRTNAISPGWIATPMTLPALTDSIDTSRINPIGRIAEPHELAVLAAFLCTDAPDFINGQTINFDGGQSAMGGGD